MVGLLTPTTPLSSGHLVTSRLARHPKRFEEAILEGETKDVEIPMINDDDDGWEPDRNRPQPGDLEYVAYPEPRLFV